MRNLLLILLLLPVTAFAQFDNNPAQQRLWNSMTNAAPAYEMLLACERAVTADLMLDDVKEMIALIVQNRNDARIALEMWDRARSQALIEYNSTLRGLAQDPEGSVCNQLEHNIIETMDSV